MKKFGKIFNNKIIEVAYSQDLLDIKDTPWMEIPGYVNAGWEINDKKWVKGVKRPELPVTTFK